MRLYAGIDGGQTSSTAAIGDETGRVLGRGNGPAADEVGEGPESTRLRDALREALQQALLAAGLAPDTHFDRIVAGISGYEGRVYGQAPVLPADSLTLVHDSINAHAGAFEEGPGVIVIAGTGSVAYARNQQGGEALAGGWGFLFGDEGSAFWLARSALAGAMHDIDASEPNALAALALTHFGQPSLRHFARAFYAGEISRAQCALFASDVIQAAERGDEAAAGYVREAAKSLVTLAMRAASGAGLGPDSRVAFTGGVTQSATMRGQIAQWMRSLLPKALHVQPKHDPAVGALILAYRDAGTKPAILE